MPRIENLIDFKKIYTKKRKRIYLFTLVFTKTIFSKLNTKKKTKKSRYSKLHTNKTFFEFLK